MEAGRKVNPIPKTGRNDTGALTSTIIICFVAEPDVYSSATVKGFIGVSELLWEGAMKIIRLIAIAGTFAANVQAADIVVSMQSVNLKGSGKSIGQITVSETAHGLVFAPALNGLPPGVHGFHLHEKPDCSPGEKDGKPGAALAAGGHFDPGASKRHGAPWGDGHLGDLPGLVVDEAGQAVYAVLAPRLTLKDVKSRALIIHDGGDNYSDQPALLGGGGARIACGTISTSVGVH